MAGHKIGRRKIPKKGSKWEIPQQKISGKTKNKMGGRPEGCITGPSNTRRVWDREEWRRLLRENSAQNGQ